jgi:ADP-heptose:LPS heptosyltransferase
MQVSREIVVVRALYLGDLLCAVPALRSLRAGEPQAHITLIGLPWARELVDRLSHYIDAFEEFPGFPGIPECPVDPRRTTDFLGRMQERRIDLAIQLHGSGSHINDFVALLGAPRCAGFHLAEDGVTQNGCFIPWPRHGSEVDRLLALTSALGYPNAGRALELPCTNYDIERARALVPKGSYACIHPGAKWASRRWAPARFAAVADALAQGGLGIVLTGAASECALTRAVRQAMDNRAIDLAGQTDLGTLAAVIRGAATIVCNDTGVSHIAAAVGTPSVVIACGSDVERWAPLASERHQVVWRHVPCRPCAHETCPTGHECATGVSVDDVLRSDVLQRLA